MLLTALALALATQSAPAELAHADSVRTDTAVHVPPARLADAYLNEGARDLVAGARRRRDLDHRTIMEYRVIGKERISAGVRAMRRDRILYRRELAADIHWRRDGVGRVEVLGGREIVPVAVPAPKVPDGVIGDAADLMFDPGEQLLGAIGGGDGIRHPLADGSEADYRFAAGDTTRIRLADGRELRLAELRVIPRRPDGLLLQGSLWLDLDSYAGVRGVFRLARPLDIVRDFVDEDDDDIPGLLQPMIFELRYLTIDYGLWNDRWWLPRLISLEGEARVGRFPPMPLRFERSYEDYQVSGDGMPPLRLSASDTPTDTVKVRRTCERDECWRYSAVQPADSVLLASEHLPPSIYDERSLISETEIRDLADVLGLGVRGPGAWHAPVTTVSYLEPGLMRYNRVEGLALGGRLDADVGAAKLDATVWLGAADLEPNGEIGVSREGFGAQQRLTGYRRLDAVAPDSRALGFGNSISALLLGRDDGDYYRSVGVELAGVPLGQGPITYSWRVFAERQSPADKSTDFSVPHVLDEDRTFRENILASPVDQVGVELTGGLARGDDPGAPRWAVRGSLLASAGDVELLRPSAAAYLGFPLPVGVVAGLEVAGGTTMGSAPPQTLWYLGGPATVRGYGGESRIAGETFWTGRAELGTLLPAARLTVFSDAGWAGSRGDFELDPMLFSAGLGASLLDGLVRIDLSRAMIGEPGWRLDAYFDGIL